MNTLMTIMVLHSAVPPVMPEPGRTTMTAMLQTATLQPAVPDVRQTESVRASWSDLALVNYSHRLCKFGLDSHTDPAKHVQYEQPEHGGWEPLSLLRCGLQSTRVASIELADKHGYLLLLSHCNIQCHKFITLGLDDKSIIDRSQLRHSHPLLTLQLRKFSGLVLI